MRLKARNFAAPQRADNSQSMRRCLAWLLLAALGACMPSQVPAREVSETARNLNLATRFGQMDMAAEHTSEAHRKQFLESRADWGREVRVVDVELAQLS